MFTGPHCFLRKEKRFERKATAFVVYDALSEHVVSQTLDFTGVAVDEDAEMMGSGHFEQCIEILGLTSSMRRSSYGWHAEQLNFAEYIAIISREGNANLDFMAEARRAGLGRHSPRPETTRPCDSHKIVPAIGADDLQTKIAALRTFLHAETKVLVSIDHC